MQREKVMYIEFNEAKRGQVRRKRKRKKLDQIFENLFRWETALKNYAGLSHDIPMTAGHLARCASIMQKQQYPLDQVQGIKLVRPG